MKRLPLLAVLTACNAGLIPDIPAPNDMTAGTGPVSNMPTGPMLAAGVLQLTDKSPADSSTGIALDASISATFDQPVDSSGAGCAAGIAVSVSAAFDVCISGASYSANDSIIFLPAKLLPGTTYYVRVQSPLAGTTGAQLTASINWHFTTAGMADTTPPTVLIAPSDGATLTQSDSITLTFSEPVDVSSVHIGGDLGAVASTFAWNGTNDTLTVSGRWAVGIEQTLAVDFSDVVGNPGVQLVNHYTVLAEPFVVSVTPPSPGLLTATSPIQLTYTSSVAPGLVVYGGSLAGNVSVYWSSSNTIGTFSPSGGTWPPGTSTLTVTAVGADGVTGDTTSLSYTVDSVAPSYLSPLGPIVIAPADPVVVQFSESMRPLPLHATGTLGVTAVTGVWSTTTFANDTLTFYTRTGWPLGPSGTIIMPGSLTDLAGNAAPANTLTCNVIVANTISATQGTVNWTTPIVITSSAPLSSNFAAYAVTGSLTASGYTQLISGNTLTLSPTPHWPPDSGQTLIVTAAGAGDVPTNTLSLTFDVLDDAVYVSPAGDDGKPGTRSQPKLSIGAGLSVADGFAPFAVHVGNGTYGFTGPLSVPPNITLNGGYDAAHWDTLPTRALATTLNPNAAGGTGTTVQLDHGDVLQYFVINSPAASVASIAVAASGALGSVTINDNTINASGAPTTYGVYGVTGSLIVTNNTITASSGATINAAIVITGASGTVQSNTINAHGGGAFANGIALFVDDANIDDNTVILGAGSYTFGVSVANTTSHLSIQRNRIYGGDASADSTGIQLESSVTASAVIQYNAIHGGTPASIATGVDIIATGDVNIGGNLIAAGGSTLLNQGVRAQSGTRVYNNTIHDGLGSSGVCVWVLANGPRIENNICFSAQGGAGGHAAFVEEGNAASPQTLRNNLIYAFGATGFAYRDYVGGASGSCASSGAFDCLAFDATSLNNDALTSTAAASSATGNVMGDPLFTDIDGADNVLSTLFTPSGVLENDWSLSGGGAADNAGLCGAVQTPPYDLPTDYAGVTLPSNGAPWSIGAYAP